MYLPKSIEQAIKQFAKLPGIGPKTAERFVFYLLKQSATERQQFIDSLQRLQGSVKICEQCFNFTETSPCAICADPQRDQTTICVVAESPDVLALEKTSEYKGVYHVLGGTINEIEGIGLEQLNFQKLVERIKQNKVKEVILALDANMEGETTAIYLIKELKPLNIKITRLARGLPMGSDIEYADEVTLANALSERQKV